MRITLKNMTEDERKVFFEHCARTGETPEKKLNRLNSILNADSVALHHTSKTKSA